MQRIIEETPHNIVLKNKRRRKKLITLNDILVGNATEDIHIEDNIGNTIKIEEGEKLMD